MNSEPFYVGVVEDRMDPLKLGRVRVRIMGLHTHDKAALPTEDLPWAYKVQPTTSGAISGIGNAPVGVVEGTWVIVQFIDQDKQTPYVTGTIGGIPQKNNPLLEEYSLDQTVLRDGSGNVVTDGSGQPIRVGEEPQPEPPKTPEPQTTTNSTGGCCSVVDASPMEAQFGSNVSVVCKALCEAGFRDPYTIIAILSNVAKESKFKLVRERVVYSSVERIRKVFPGSTKNMSDAELQQYVNNEVKFANFIYANKIGNGNEASGDGFKYRGGGFVQLTGRANYRQIGNRVGVDLENSPESINDPAIAAKAVAEFMKSRVGTPVYSSLDEATRAITKAINPGGLSMDLPKVNNFAKLCYVIGTQTPAQQQATTQTAKPKSTLGFGYKIDTNEFEDPSVGFKDPNGVYPLKDQLGEPDTNRLARNEKISKTSVYRKEQTRHTGVPQANGTGEWDQSPPPYSAAYPFNNVWQSESGHIMEFDDTKGRERINILHRTGTFTEIDHNGTQVNFIVGDGYHIYERNGYVHLYGNLNVTVDGAHTLKVEGNTDVQIDGNATINIHSNAKLNVAGNLDLTVGGNYTAYVGGEYSVRSGGNMSQDAPKIDLNSGLSKSLETIPAIGPSSVNFKELTVLTRGEEIAIEYEITEDDPVAVKVYQEKMIEEGILTKEEMDKPPETIEEKKPEENNVQEKQLACDSVAIDQTVFTGSEKLSNYYKLGDLNANNTRKLISVNGFSPAEVFCNLQALAVNCLDPIRARWPDVKINSGLRTDVIAGSSNKSKHLTGQAVDISFPGLSRADLYTRILEVQKMIPYDQLILEYANGPGWIHISFDKKGNRKQQFTMNHHKRVSKDLFTIVRVY